MIKAQIAVTKNFYPKIHSMPVRYTEEEALSAEEEKEIAKSYAAFARGEAKSFREAFADLL